MHVGRVSTNALMSDRICRLGVWMCLHPNTLCFEKCEGLLNKMSKLWNKMFYTWEKIQICRLILTQIHWELKTYNFTPIYLFTTTTQPLKRAPSSHKFTNLHTLTFAALLVVNVLQNYYYYFACHLYELLNLTDIPGLRWKITVSLLFIIIFI